MRAVLAEKPQTFDDYQDFLANSEDERYELLGGEIVKRPMPRPRHGLAQKRTDKQLLAFDSDGRFGGWVILSEIDVRYDSYNCPTHDLAGWRRERLPVLPDKTIDITPDWVCEILSPGHERKDLFDNLLLLQRYGVPHYWILSPEKRTFMAYQLIDDKYVLTVTAEDDAKLRVEPFTEIELSLKAIFDL
jgi:Uma2 family endonuclease